MASNLLEASSENGWMAGNVLRWLAVACAALGPSEAILVQATWRKSSIPLEDNVLNLDIFFNFFGNVNLENQSMDSEWPRMDSEHVKLVCKVQLWIPWTLSDI